MCWDPSVAVGLGACASLWPVAATCIQSAPFFSRPFFFRQEHVHVPAARVPHGQKSQSVSQGIVLGSRISSVSTKLN